MTSACIDKVNLHVSRVGPTKNGGGELLKKDCPIKRHLRVVMEIDGDEEEDAHVFPITCAELLKWKI